MLDDLALVEAHQVEFGYRGGWRLGPIDLELNRGVTALIGPNGAGKSTLIRMLAGITIPHSGGLYHRGELLRRGNAVNEFRRNVGYLPQHPRWSSGWLVRDYVDFVAMGYGVRRRECASAREGALEAAGAVEFSDRRLGTLSGGQRQRVHLAAAIAHGPAVLILDEPTVGLDPAERVRIRTFLREQAVHRSVLLATHLMDDVAMSADRIVVMLDGTVKWCGDVAALEAMAPVSQGGISRAEAGYLAVVGR